MGVPSRPRLPGALPPILAGSRRRGFLRLAGLGLLQAAAGFALILAIGALDRSGGQWGGLPSAAAALCLVALALVALRAAETVEAERVAQDYVNEVRLLLLAASPSRRPGVSMSRMLSDLSALRNWVGLGAARLAVAPIGVAGCLGAAATLSPAHVLVVAVPLLVVGLLALWPLASLFRRVGDVRRARGRLANRLADAVMQPGERSERVAGRVARAGGELRDRLVARAAPAGVLRALPVLVMPLAVALAALLGLPLTGGAVGAILVAGLAADTLRQVLRAAEYRIAFLVARDRLAPGLGTGGPPHEGSAPMSQ